MSDKTPTTETDRAAELAAVRAQILADQASGAKRDDDAIKAEQDWHRENGSKK